MTKRGKVVGALLGIGVAITTLVWATKAKGGKTHIQLQAGLNDIVYTGKAISGGKLLASIQDYLISAYWRMPEWDWWDDINPSTIIYDRAWLKITVDEVCVLVY